MNKELYLEILTPEHEIFADKVKLVKVPGSKGSFEVLYNHAPIISTLEPGEIKIVTHDEGIKLFELKSNGLIEVKKNQVIILAEQI
jgi:F-type H+-transporting ATPase subunit epsilon